MRMLLTRWDSALVHFPEPNLPQKSEWFPTDAPLKRSQRNIHEHCDWLSRYQVDGESFSAIADSVGMQRQSVTEAIKNIASLLELPLRSPTLGGRPKN